MGATTFTLPQQNSREQILSTDINRGFKLSSREAQNCLENGSHCDNFVDIWGNPLIGVEGAPVDRSDRLGSITGSVGSYDLNISSGQVFMSVPAPDADSSGYTVVRWATQVINTITPDAATFRVDLIVATPAMVPADLQSRNILVDPVLRTVTPQNVYKTSNPLATLSVVPGTPGDPSPPAVPVGSVALWEVVTYNTDADSTSYRFTPRIWRRVESFASCHAILENCIPSTGATSADPPYLPYGRVHRAIIAGEVICAPLVGAFNVDATPDTNNNPTTAALDADRDLPCFLYLCGGRYAPQNGVGVAVTPLRLVASLTAPNGNRASADLAIAGVTVPKAGTLYSGVWFIKQNTHDFKRCAIEGDWIYAAEALNVATAIVVAYGFTDNDGIGSGASGTLTFVAPASSTFADLGFGAADTGATKVLFYEGAAPGSAVTLTTVVLDGSLLTGLQSSRLPILSGASFSWDNASAAADVQLFAKAFNMNVPRIG